MSREWDQGKDQWQQEGWEDHYSQGQVRGREGDYPREGKRQKHNDGGYDNQAYNDAGWNEGGDPSSTDWSQNRPKKRLVPSEPSEHVIFLGLDPDFNESDLQSYLAGHGCSVESVTIIRDRNTGLSKGFGFAQFASAEHAKVFVEPFFPFVSVPPPASHGASATAAFKKALETGGPHAGRRVKIDFSQSANPGDKGRRNANDGTRDIGNSPAPVLLLRGLDSLAGPGAITQAMRAAEGPNKEGAKGMRRIILIKDKVTMASWGFGFVEFIDTASAAAVLAASMSAQLHPNGFCVAEKPVAVSWAQVYSFQPVDPMHRDEACLKGTSVLGGSEQGWVRYWDAASTVAVAEFEVQTPAASTKDKEKEKKKRKVAEKAAAPPEASLLPVSNKPVTLSFKSGLSLNKTVSTAKAGGVTSAFGGQDEEEDEGQDEDPAHAKVAAARKVAPMIASKKTASNINKWNQVQEVLSAAVPSAAKPTNEVPTSHSAKAVVSQLAAASSSKAKTPPTEPSLDMDITDVTGKICLLCARQFKTPEQTQRHIKESDLHKKNLKDEKLVETARAKALAARNSPQLAGPASAGDTAPKYRDRASERRIMHNQPDVPMPEAPLDGGNGRATVGNAPQKREVIPPPMAPVHPGKDESNVGNKLLKMMGWKEGEGLGEHGEGIAEPIQTSMFASGVGLGAAKGHEIGKHPDGYAGYLSKGKDMARDRYDRTD